MDAWIVIDFLNDTVEKVDTEEEAIELVKEWAEESGDMEEVKVYHVLEEYKCDVQVHLIPSTPETKAKKKK